MPAVKPVTPARRPRPPSDVVARRARHGHGTEEPHDAAGPLPVDGIHAAAVDPNQQLTRSGLGIWALRQFQFFRATVTAIDIAFIGSSHIFITRRRTAGKRDAGAVGEGAICGGDSANRRRSVTQASCGIVILCPSVGQPGRRFMQRRLAMLCLALVTSLVAGCSGGGTACGEGMQTCDNTCIPLGAACTGMGDMGMSTQDDMLVGSDASLASLAVSPGGLNPPFADGDDLHSHGAAAIQHAYRDGGGD